MTGSFDYPGGALPSPEDTRDWRLSRCMDMPSGAVGELLPNRFECYIPEGIRDQGQTASCTAYAASLILACIAHKLYGGEELFSAGFLYGNRRETNWKEPGEIMRDVPKKVAKWGDVPEKVWENNAEAPEILWDFEESYPVVGDLSRKLVAGYVRLKDKTEAKAFMVRYGIPLFVNLPMKKISPLMSSDGYHAVACYKYSPLGFSCVNSWGENNIPYITDKKFDDFEEVWGMIPAEKITFSDVPEEHWAKSAIEEAAARGEMQGFPDGLFHPEEPITRAQAAVLLQRLRMLQEGGGKA